MIALAVSPLDEKENARGEQGLIRDADFADVGITQHENLID